MPAEITLTKSHIAISIWDIPTRLPTRLQVTYCRRGDKKVAPQAHVRATTGRGGQGQQFVEHLCLVCDVCGVCVCACDVCVGYFDFERCINQDQ